MPTQSIVLVMNKSAMELYASLFLAAISHASAKGINDVINAVHWNKLVILCDQTYEYCPGEKLFSTRPSSYHILDLQNTSLLVTKFEGIYKLSQMNWLVFCSDCVPLLSVINAFESSHQLQGYFTHMYQWILVTNFAQTKPHLEEHVGGITNVALLDVNIENNLHLNTNNNLYTAMFGSVRYFDLVRPHDNYSSADIFPNLVNGFSGAKLKLCVVPLEPFIIQKSEGVYTGYYIKLLELMAEELNFTFTVYEPEDGLYGNIEDGEWTGLIKELIDKKADLAAALSVSPERSRVVDHPNTAIDVDEYVIIYHKPDPIFMSLYILSMPFQQAVWMCVVGTLAAASVMFLLSHYLHSKWEGTHCKTFQYGTYIFQSTISQGSTVQPIHQSMRIVYGVYSLGCIILITAYTGHLVALLVLKHSPVPFNSILQLAYNTEYTLGALGGSSSASDIVDCDITSGSPMAELQAKLLRDADKDPSVLSPVYEDHIQRLLTQNYAFYGTRSMYDALAEQYCSVSAMKISGNVLANYMLQKNSVYTLALNNMLVKTGESEVDVKLIKEFWLKPKECVENDDQVVHLENISGVFYVLSVGISFSFAAFIAENIFWFMVRHTT